MKKWCTLGEVKYVRQVSDVRSANSITSEHTAHLEINMNDKKFEFCTKTLDINVYLIEWYKIECNYLYPKQTLWSLSQIISSC